MDWASHIRRILVHLGEDATVIGATTGNVRGMFLAPYERINLGLTSGISSSSPTFVAMSADLPSAPTAVITSRGTHRVAEPKPDDPGGYTLLELHEA